MFWNKLNIFTKIKNYLLEIWYFKLPSLDDLENSSKTIEVDYIKIRKLLDKSENLPEDETDGLPKISTFALAEQFASFLSDSLSYTINHKPVVDDKVFEFGMSPDRFLLVFDGDQTLFSFYFDCDPMFPALVFATGRECFGQDAFISNSFLYRLDGSVCFTIDEDFQQLYTDYYSEIIKRSKGILRGSKNTLLN